MASNHDPRAPRSKNCTVLSDDRVELAFRAIVESASKGEIKRLLKAQFGLGFRACKDIYTAALKRRAFDFHEGDPQRWRMEALVFYANLRNRGKCRVRDRLKAQERIDKILAPSFADTRPFPALTGSWRARSRGSVQY